MAIKAGELIVALYVLRDPRTDEVRYVGATRDPVARLRSHLEESASRKSHKASWIASLKTEGLRPSMDVVDWVPLEEWREAERALIALLRADGVRLTNLADGGEGGAIPQAQTPEARARRAASLRGQRRTPEQRARMATARHRKLARPGARPRPRLGERNEAKLTESEVLQIREAYDEGLPRRLIAREFGITYQNVWLIGTRRAWTHLKEMSWQ